MSARFGLGLLLLLGTAPLRAEEKPPEAPKPVRVLLVAGSPSWEYQNVRAILTRAVADKRAELSIYLQAAVGAEGGADVHQDVAKERLLTSFPDRLDKKEKDAEKQYYDLAAYDVVVAFDPDWSRLTADQTMLLQKWVDTKKGGLVVVAGPLHTYQLARPVDTEKVKPVCDLLPVVVADDRIALERRGDTPFALQFPGKAGGVPFMAVEEGDVKPLAFWDRFFDPKAETPRGFYSCHPVKSLKPGAVVVARCADPARKMTDGSDAPYLALMSYGNGRVVYLGSAEMWRIRRVDAGAHERFWTKLMAYAAQR